MPRFQRYDHAPRFEMTPLLDVIFLLLTFFIYSQVLMVRPYVLPVSLPTAGTAEAAEPIRVVGITLDAGGAVYVNEQPTSFAALEARLAELRDAERQTQVFVAVEDAPAADAVDRSVQLIRLMDLLREHGIEEYGLVVSPGGEGPRAGGPGAEGADTDASNAGGDGGR